jgi:putative inorganic carbon (HCO3(-)) transporter
MFAGREHSSNSYRFNVWISSWQMFLDNWWFGIGPGNSTFRLAYGLYMRSGFDALGTYCVPLEVAVEAGVIGLATFGWLLVTVMARAHQCFWSSGDAQVRWLAAAAAAAIAGMMLHGLVDTVFYRPQVQFVFWLMVASVVALSIWIKNSSVAESSSVS